MLTLFKVFQSFHVLFDIIQKSFGLSTLLLFVRFFLYVFAYVCMCVCVFLLSSQTFYLFQMQITFQNFIQKTFFVVVAYISKAHDHFVKQTQFLFSQHGQCIWTASAFNVNTM